MLLPVLGRGTDPQDTEKRRRVLINTIGPVWDGNEVWVLTAGGATFAAFPHWYATMFSAFYLPLLLILVALIVRNLGFDYRGKRDDDRWRANWDTAIVVGSFVPAFLWGVALTNLVRGLPIDADKEFTGTLFTLLNPVSLLGGLVTLGLFLTHGALFTALKTTGPIREDARAVATRAGVVTAVLAVVLLGILGLQGGNAASWATTVVAAGALVSALVANLRAREGWAFVGTFVAIAMAVATYFLLLFPDVMPSTLDEAWSLTVDNASSTPYTLKIMTIVALVFTPIVLLYQSWTYWVFRRRIGTHHIPAASAPAPAPPAPAQR
jgi:cytochrome d ubiquinol oxidase subunit II